jgi:hypothetical protein
VIFMYSTWKKGTGIIGFFTHIDPYLPRLLQSHTLTAE